MQLKHTDPEYTIDELILLLKNEIKFDENFQDTSTKVKIDEYIEYIDKKEKNLHRKNNEILSISNKVIEDNAKKILSFLNIDKFIEFIFEKKYKGTDFYDTQTEELDSTGIILLENVLSGLNHSYDDLMKELKKDS